MATSLSRQLSKLRAPQTTAFKESKTRASFLYDRNEAKTIDIDAHFAIALTGLEALSSIYPPINSFRESLFKEESKESERGLLSGQENEELNNEIRRFLYEVVSPYLLLTPTHKMIEWLLVKYRIHEYNSDDFLFSSLPYHETKLFSKIAQLVGGLNDEKHFWHWLRPIAKHGIPLSKHVLVNHCESDLGFFKSLCDLMLYETSNPASSSIRSSFLAAIVMNVLDKSVNEEILSIIIQNLTTGLKVKNTTVITSCFITIAFLTHKVVISEKVMQKLMNRMLRAYRKYKLKEELQENYLLTMMAIFSNQKIKQIPGEFIEEFDFNTLQRFISIPKAQYFLVAILSHLIWNCEDITKDNLLHSILQMVDCSEIVIEKCLETVFAAAKGENVGRRKLSAILNKIERRFPCHFDKYISKMPYMEVKDLLVSSLYVKAGQSHCSVELALNHANKEIRLAAIAHLEENMNKLDKNESGIKNSIIRAMKIMFEEESSEVLLTVLSKREIFRRLFDQRTLVGVGSKLLRRVCVKLDECQRLQDEAEVKRWRKVSIATVILVCDQEFTSEKEFFEAVLPLMLPKNGTESLKLFWTVLKSNAASSSKLCVKLNKEKPTDVTDFPRFVIELTRKVAELYVSRQSCPLLDLLYESRNVSHLIYSLCIMRHILTTTKDFDLYSETSLRIIILYRRLLKKKHIKHGSVDFDSFEELVRSNEEFFESDIIPENLLYFVVKEIINSTLLPDVKPGWFWHTFPVQNTYLFSLFSFLCDSSFHKKTKVSKLFKPLLLEFLKKTVNSVGISFLSSLWANIDNETLQARSLAVSIHVLSDKQNYVLSDIDSLSLLIALNSESTSIRQLALNILYNVKLSYTGLHNCLSRNLETIQSCSLAVSDVLTSLQGGSKKPTEILTSIVNFTIEEQTPLRIKYGLLLLLRKCNARQFVAPLESILPSTLTCNTDTWLYKIGEEILFKMVNFLQNCTSTDDELIAVLFNALKYENCRTFCLQKLKPKWFTGILSGDMKVIVLKHLLDSFFQLRDQIIRRKLSRLVSDGHHIVKLLDMLTQYASNEVTSVAKRRRTMLQIELSMENDSWKKVLILLEIVTEKETLANSSELMKKLFKLLEQTFTLEEKPSLEYFRFILIAAIRGCLRQEDCDRRGVIIQAALESFRHSRRRETQREALLLINSVTPHFREEILQNVMLIFGFIGSNLIQCDDEFSLRVMDDTMEQIIPIVTGGDELIQDNVVEVFIDAIKDIAAHRRLHLFRKLSLLLDKESHLWFIVFKLTERLITMSKDEQKDFLDFARTLVSSYDTLTQLNTFVVLIQVTSLLNSGSSVIFRRNISYNVRQRQEMVQFLSSSLLNMISCDEFKLKIDECEWEQINSQLHEFMKNMLSLIESLAKEGVEKRSISYTKTVSRTLYKILEKVHSLLPIEEMLSIIESLLTNENVGIQRKALEILNSILNEDKIEIKHSLLSRFIHHLCAIVGVGKQTCNDSLLTNAQMAFLSIKLLTKCHDDSSKKSSALFEKALQLVIEILQELNTNASQNVIACAILCMTQLAVTVGNKAIPFLPSVTSIILKYFVAKSAVVVLACVAALTKVVRQFSGFLSSSLTQIIAMSCNAMGEYSEDQMFSQKFKVVKKHLATLIPMRTLIESIANAFNELSTQSEEPTLSLLSIFCESLSNAEQSDLEANLPTAQKFIFTALDYRNVYWKVKTAIAIDSVEDKCIQCIVTMVPKLSEKTFRPFFYRLYDWAIRTKELQIQRVLTFYRVMNKLAETLRSLFSVYAAPFIVNNCVLMLDTLSESNVEESTGHLVLTNVLLTVSKCFLYDDGTFSTPERLDKLVPSLVNQLNNDVGTPDMQDFRVKECLTKCVENYVRAVSDSTCVKDLHYKLLLKTREDSSKIRCNALYVYHQLVLAMKGEYLPLLPEAVSFLAELNEDDCTDIQKLLITVFHDVEEIVGEPITEYF